MKKLYPFEIKDKIVDWHPLIVNETTPKIPNPIFTAEIDTSGLSSLVKQALIAGIVKDGIKAAKSNGVKNLAKSPTKKISLVNKTF